MSPYCGGGTGGGSLAVVPLGFIVGGLVLLGFGVDLGLGMVIAGVGSLGVLGAMGLLQRLL